MPIRFDELLDGVPIIDNGSGRLMIGPPEFPGKVCASIRKIGVFCANKNASLILETHPNLQMGDLISYTRFIGNPIGAQILSA